MYVVTGAAGFIAGHLMREMHRREMHTIIAIDPETDA